MEVGLRASLTTEIKNTCMIIGGPSPVSRFRVSYNCSVLLVLKNSELL